MYNETCAEDHIRHSGGLQYSIGRLQAQYPSSLLLGTDTCRVGNQDVEGHSELGFEETYGRVKKLNVDNLAVRNGSIIGLDREEPSHQVLVHCWTVGHICSP